MNKLYFTIALAVGIVLASTCEFSMGQVIPGVKKTETPSHYPNLLQSNWVVMNSPKGTKIVGISDPYMWGLASAQLVIDTSHDGKFSREELVNGKDEFLVQIVTSYQYTAYNSWLPGKRIAFKTVGFDDLAKIAANHGILTAMAANTDHVFLAKATTVKGKRFIQFIPFNAAGVTKIQVTKTSSDYDTYFGKVFYQNGNVTKARNFRWT